MAAIVTGGGTGIGAAISHRLAADGHAVAVMGRRPEPLQEVVSGLAEGIALVGDVSRSEDCGPRAASSPVRAGRRTARRRRA